MTKRNAIWPLWALGMLYSACYNSNSGGPGPDQGLGGASGGSRSAKGGAAGGGLLTTGGTAGSATTLPYGAGGSVAPGLDGAAGNTAPRLDGAIDNATGAPDARADVPAEYADGSAGRGGTGGNTAISAGGATGRGGTAGSTVVSRGGATGRGGSAGNTAISSGGAAGTTAGSNGGAAGGGGVVLDASGLRDSGGKLDVAGGAEVPVVAGCRIFPADNPWNLDVSGYPLNGNSATYLANMSPGTAFHPDWGTVSDGYGIPFASGTGATPQPITWTADWGASESDPLPCPSGGGKFCYPIPLTAPIEGGTSADADADRHVLYLDTAGGPDNCTLYELYNAQNPTGSSGWTAANGAIFHLGSNALRTDGWTSADAAGLPILPGLVRFDEVMAGEIRHAIRFTVSRSSQGYIHPATHAAGNSNTSLPPMGLRLRLKADFDTSKLSGPTLVILTAMKKYGIILADNGSNWYITGESNEGWAPHMDGLLSGLRQLHGSDFEVVDTGPVSTEGS